MKKVLITSLLFLSIYSYSQENKFERPNYFIGVTPFKPFISSAVGLTFHKKITETTYWGLEPVIYTKIKGAMHHPADGIKIYGSYRTYFSENRTSSFYGQINFGGGYFTQNVTYVAEYFDYEEYYPIHRQKQFLALGGCLQPGYHLMFNRFSLDFNLGVQILKRILAESVEYQGVEFRRNIAQDESFYSDNMNWVLFEAGSIINASLTIKYNIF